MTELPEDRCLFREAADLAIRLQNDPANPVSVKMVRAWVARSPTHEATWSKVAEIHGMTGQILAKERKAARGGGLSRRNLVIGGAIGLSAAAAGTWGIPRAILAAKADYMTATAEIRRVALSDGSAITLGPDSAVSLDYTDTRRGIDLMTGMAFFEVANDPARPFAVRCGELTATALGAAFDVSNDAGFISVAVDHGVVKASAPGSELRLGEQLNVGDWITLDVALQRIIRGTRDASQIAAWRDGMIVADKETVSAMVAKIARWQRGSVVLAEPSLGSRVVSGVFDLHDPTRALEAVVRPFGAKVRKVTPFITVISPV
jgi:transmembrane sensor